MGPEPTLRPTVDVERTSNFPLHLADRSPDVARLRRHPIRTLLIAEAAAVACQPTLGVSPARIPR